MRHSEQFLSLSVSESILRLGARIRAARKARKLTLAALEKTCRIHRTTLGRLERGDAGISLGVFLSVLETLNALADVELLVSQPLHQPGQPVKPIKPVLERDF